MAEPIYGQIKAGKAPFINSAAKYLVCGELRRRDVLASPGPMNTGIIEATAAPTVTVRVKAMKAAASSWVWMAKENGALFTRKSRDDFTVLVDMGDGSQPVEYFILPTPQLEHELIEEHAEWLSTPGPRGRRHSPSNRMHRFGYNEMQRRWLQRYTDWAPLVSRLAARRRS